MMKEQPKRDWRATSLKVLGFILIVSATFLLVFSQERLISFVLGLLGLLLYTELLGAVKMVFSTDDSTSDRLLTAGFLALVVAASFGLFFLGFAGTGLLFYAGMAVFALVILAVEKLHPVKLPRQLYPPKDRTLKEQPKADKLKQHRRRRSDE